MPIPARPASPSRAAALRAGLLALAAAAALAGCAMVDGATRIAYALESGVRLLGPEEGATMVLEGLGPSDGDTCTAAYRAQFDRVGALVVWCMDAAGAVASSHSTSYHARFVDTADTVLVEKAAGETLAITLERRGERPVITAVR